MNRTLKLERIFYATFALQLLIALFAISAWSQTPTVDGQFTELMEKSETYDKYKVISKTRLDALWSNVQTELNTKNLSVTELKAATAEARITNDSLRARVNSLTRKLNESEMRNGSIPFIGIDIAHNVYHVAVWSIIGLLVSVLVYFGLRFKMNSQVFDQLLLEKETLASEHEDHKFNAHQKMLKIKRELQTALNKLEEVQVH